MFRDTVVLSLRFAEELRWSTGHKRLSLRRSAGRARNYFRRHARVEVGRIVALSALAICARLPIPFPYPRAMSYIAQSYDLILASRTTPA